MIFKFSSPPKSEVVVFDGHSIKDLKYILEKKSYLVVENRKERIKIIYFGIGFLINCLKNFILNFFNNKNLHTIYLFTLITTINPKLVITSTDNSFKFSDLAKLLKKKIKFVAIQNATRFDFILNDYLFKKKIINKDLNKIFYYIPNYYCFGQREIDDAKKYNLQIDNFFKVGSIRVANFFRLLEKNKIRLNNQKYDICLISEPQPGLNTKLNSQDLEESFILPVKFAIKYVKNHNLKLIFAQKRYYDTPANYDEINFFKRYLEKNEFEFLFKNSTKKKDVYSSYYPLFESKMAVGVGSTLLLDKLGCKEKILSINSSIESIFDFPINGICKLKGRNFNDFNSRVTDILNMSTDEYLRKIEKPIDYVMVFDKKESTIDKIRNQIFQNINRK